MGESETAPEQAADLRREAEKIYRERAARSPENMANCGSTLQQDVHAIPQDLPTMTGMIHELRVHQIELEMQNSALRQRQEELDAARARYFDLYELAPVGYITVSKQGLIIEANLTAATMLGMVRGGPGHAHSIFSQFIHTEDQDIYYRFRKQLLETGMPQVCEQRMVKKEGPVFLAHLEATVAPDPSTGTLRQGSGKAGQVDEPAIRIVISDITVG
ncbi:MAG: PAS domain-containing protein, partial [Syntrophales bacterium]